MIKLIATSLVVLGTLSAQPAPVFRVTVSARTTKAVSYQHRSGSTKIDFAGTDLLPLARGGARVESKQGHIQIEAEFNNLQPATKYGAEFLTYVLWAVTPEGRTVNLGEVLINGQKSKLNVSTDLQVFGLVVTAEPYYAVTRPSELIVMENAVRSDTAGKIEFVDAKYELLQRGHYDRLANPLELKADKKQPLELYQARNAVQIARGVGADRFAEETFRKAEKSLAQAEAYQARKAGNKPVTMTAREAVQMAEDSRVIAIKRQEDDVLTAERQRSSEREADARSETNRVTEQAEAARLKAAADTLRMTQEQASERLAASREADMLKRENQLKVDAAQTESNRLKLESDSKLAAAGAEADRLKRENDAQKAASKAELDIAASQKTQLETDKVELRTQLLKQFNLILQTRDTARGLIVNMSDVLFDTGKYSLRPMAREKLAKVAGIVSGHPGLRLDVEGHTDDVGGDEYNQLLSERRGGAVRDYLTQQGMAESSVSTKGFGKSQPVASNTTTEGRQQNRRVELVISGEVIGAEIGASLALK